MTKEIDNDLEKERRLADELINILKQVRNEIRDWLIIDQIDDSYSLPNITKALESYRKARGK